jgi:hypothetical protein
MKTEVTTMSASCIGYSYPTQSQPVKHFAIQKQNALTALQNRSRFVLLERNTCQLKEIDAKHVWESRREEMVWKCQISLEEGPILV